MIYTAEAQKLLWIKGNNKHKSSYRYNKKVSQK